MKTSVIIPVYNGEKHLHSCFQRMEQQTTQDFEMIYVDDGSTDGTANLLDTYALDKKNVSVIHQKNKGVSGARNTGLEHVHGEYVMFFDVDDTWDRHMIEDMTCLMERTKGTLGICGYQEKEDTVTFTFRPSQKSYSQADLIEHILKRHDIHCSLWNKIFNVRKIRTHAIRFDESISIGEDMLFLLQYCSYVDTAFALKACYYTYQKNIDSAMFSFKKEKSFQESWLTEWDAIRKAEYVLDTMGYPLSFLLEKKVNVANKILYLMGVFHYKDPRMEKELVYTIRQHWKAYMKTNLSLVRKGSITLNAISPRMCRWIKTIRDR